jgi:hypothetical protein
VKWYVDGQHRWGGIDRYFANLESRYSGGPLEATDG